MTTRRESGTQGPRFVLLATALVFLPIASAAEGPTREVVDETGRVVRVPTRIERVISLAPNVTEIIYALGQEERLVGITNQCDFPPAARAKARIGDVINPSLERIIELKPDVVLGSKAGNRRETVELLEHADIPLYGVAPRSVDGILTSIRHVAELLAVPQAGEELAGRLEERLGALPRRLAQRRRPRVLFILWLEPLLTVGGDTFLNDILRRAGADSVTADVKEDWPRLSLEVVIERDPDFLVLPRTPSLEARLAELATRPPWSHLRAVEQHHIVWLDESVMRPGPRVADAVESLARALHPEAFSPLEVAR